MTIFADELRAGTDEAARKVAEARLAGDDHYAEAYRERLSYLQYVAGGHGVELLPRPWLAADGQAGGGRPGETAGRGRRG
jgi:hypothetical protein